MKPIRFYYLIICLVVLPAPVASAQVSINGSLRGLIADQSEAAVAGATVTLTNTENNSAINATTNDEGLYTFPRLAPGLYTLSVEREGFQRAVRERLSITVNESVTLNLTLSIGTVSETVTIQGSAQTVQAQGVEISQLVSEGRVRNLPLNGENFNRTTTRL